MNTNLISFALLAVVCLLAYLLAGQCSDRQTEREARIKLQGDSTALAIREAAANQRLAEKQAQADRAAARAIQEQQERTNRDNQTALMIAALSRPQQNQTALDYLIANGFLSREDYQNRPVEVSADSNVTRAVAVQGKVLSDTRNELQRKDTVLLETIEEKSDLERVLNNEYERLNDTRLYVQDRIAERGLLRAKSRKQFREVDRQLSQQQKALNRR